MIRKKSFLIILFLSSIFKLYSQDAPYSWKIKLGVNLINIQDKNVLSDIAIGFPSFSISKHLFSGISIGTQYSMNKIKIKNSSSLDYYSIDSNLLEHAYTHINFHNHAKQFGKFGGYAYLKTLIDSLKSDVNDNCLLLDGGDTWQGSGLSFLENGRDMVAASNLLGVDVMTGHWEFTYGEKLFLENINAFNGDFVAQNISLTEEAIFEGLEPKDNDDHFQDPYVIKVINGARVAIIGQAFPYTPIANPKRLVPNLTFGIKDAELQMLINDIKEKEKPSLVVLLSHNGVDVDKKMASKVNGVDIIFGGHTHDVLPKPIIIKNNNSQTLVINSGCNGKFISVLDLNIRQNSFSYRYKLLPVLYNNSPTNPVPAPISRMGVSVFFE